MTTSPESLFLSLKFYVPPHVTDYVGLRTILTNNGAILTENPGSDAFYVFEDWNNNNELFSQLSTRGTRIISPKCIYESVQNNKPLPEITHPLFARFMEGLTLSMEKTPELDEFRSLVLYMGGTLEDTVTEMTDYLIANKVGSIQYQLARHRKLPILSPDWIRGCWKTEKLLPFEPFLLRPFVGCIISVTGLSANTRNEIQRLIKAYGGEYTANLTKRCTHLIAQQPQGIKYRYALEWGIHCVTTHWLFDSINSQVCGDETQYFLPMSEATRQALFNPLFTSTRDFNRLSPALREKHLMQLQRRHYSSRVPELFLMKGSSDKFEEEDEDFNDYQNSGNSNHFGSVSTLSSNSVLGNSISEFPTNFGTSLKQTKNYEDLADGEEHDINDTQEVGKEQLVSQLQQLLDATNQTIEFYQKLAKEQDISEFINLFPMGALAPPTPDIPNSQNRNTPNPNTLYPNSQISSKFI